MLIRDAVITDAAGLAEMHVAAWGAAYRGIMSAAVLDGLCVEKRREMWIGELANPKRRTVLCELDGRIIGFASWGPSRDADAAPQTAELIALYVHPDHWRRGIGTALWRETAAHVAPTYRELTLWVLRDNDRARRFYERIGFSLEGDAGRVIAWHTPPLAEVRYRMPLGLSSS